MLSYISLHKHLFIAGGVVHRSDGNISSGSGSETTTPCMLNNPAIESSTCKCHNRVGGWEAQRSFKSMCTCLCCCVKVKTKTLMHACPCPYTCQHLSNPFLGIFLIQFSGLFSPPVWLPSSSGPGSLLCSFHFCVMGSFACHTPARAGVCH